MADGRLPRFLPLRVGRRYRRYDVDQPLRSEVVVVDLDEGRASPPRPVTSLPQVIATAESAHIFRSLDGVLIAIDQSDGGATGGWRIDRLYGSDLRADDFRHGLLWLFGCDHAAPSSLPHLVVDLGSGTVPYRRGTVTPHELEGDLWQALLPPELPPR
jgi:hypothetical protein